MRPIAGRLTPTQRAVKACPPRHADPHLMISRPLHLLPITVAIPVKDEGANLAACLERLACFAEVVVIDSGSTDRTREIAEQYGARIVDFLWNGRYPKKRNWFLLNDEPTQAWVLSLDADELLDERFCNEISLAVCNPNYDGYWLNYKNYFLGRPLRYGVLQRKLALFRVGKGLYERIDEDRWSGLDMEIHEHPVIEGPVGEISSPIDHRDDRGLERFVAKHLNYALWEARRFSRVQNDHGSWINLTRRQRFKYRHISKWWFPWFYFIFTYIAKFGFLDRGAGFNYAFYKVWYFQTIRLLIRGNRLPGGADQI